VHSVMSSLTMSITEAADFVGDSEFHCLVITSIFLTMNFPGVPLFSLTNSQYLRNQLKLYEACNYQPTKGHPLVQEWIKG
jgi:hypothetical protein